MRRKNSNCKIPLDVPPCEMTENRKRETKCFLIELTLKLSTKALILIMQIGCYFANKLIKTY